MLKLNIGSGPYKPLEGFTNVDLLDGAYIDIVAPSHKLPIDNNSVDEILCEHMIEHLTYYQFNRTLAEWQRVLKVGGLLTIECPDLLGICKQFVESNEYGRYTTYKGGWPLIAQIAGHQRGRSDEEILSQVHKSGYTMEHLKIVLEGAGFGMFKELVPTKVMPFNPAIRLASYKI